MRRWLSIFATLGATFSNSSVAQDLASAPLGTKLSGLAATHERYVPLPPGEFELIARRNAKSTTTRDFQGRVSGPGHATDLAYVHLVSAPRGAFDSAVYILANGSGHFGGWYLPPAVCKPDGDPFLAYANPGNTTKRADCWMVNFRSFSLGTNPTSDWQDFIKRTDVLGRPRFAVTWTFFIVDNGDHVWVQYMFNPAKWKIPPTESWAKAEAMTDPRKARVYDMLAGQTQSLADAIRIGVGRRSPSFAWRLD